MEGSYVRDAVMVVNEWQMSLEAWGGAGPPGPLTGTFFFFFSEKEEALEGCFAEKEYNQISLSE